MTLFKEKSSGGYGDKKSPASFSVKKIRKKKDDALKGAKKAWNSKAAKGVRKEIMRELKFAWRGEY